MVRQTCQVSGTVHAGCVGIHHTAHKHTAEWSHIPLVRDPQLMFPGNQGSRLQIPDTEANKPCLEQANMAHL